MVTGPTRYTGAEYYRTLLEAVYARLAAMPTTDFQGQTSDRFVQARGPLDGRETPEHLAAWLDLGSAEVGRSGVAHKAELTYAHRWQHDDSSRSQARIHGSARAVIEMLLSDWTPTGGERLLPQGYAVELRGVDFATVTIAIQLLIPRG